MTSLFQNLRFGARMLLRAPGISGCIVLILALGIGANSAIFGVVDCLVLHPAPYAIDSLVFLWTYDSKGVRNSTSPANFLDLRAQSKSLTGIAAWVPTFAAASGMDRPRQVAASVVTSNFFDTLGAKPLLGRTFLRGEDGLDGAAGVAHTAVISYRYWQQDLGADPNVIGRVIELDLEPATIVGVMPPDFQFWFRPEDIWAPIHMDIHDRDYTYLTVIAHREAPLAGAQAEANVIARNLADAYPKSDRHTTIAVEDFRDRLLNQTFRSRLWLLTGAVGLLLLIACTNIASLLLARSAAREREMAVRVSLGATGSRIAAQLLTETALLSTAGGSLGLLLAWSLIRTAPKIVPFTVIPGALSLSWLVVGFTAALSILTSMLCGLAPALASARGDVQAVLRESSRGSTAGKSRQRFRQSMVAAETAIALMLLAGGGVMIESLSNLTRADTGFNPNNVLALRLFLPLSKYNAQGELLFNRTALRRLSILPGVEAVATGSSLPLINNQTVSFDVEGAPPRGLGEKMDVPYAAVSPDYFRVMRIPLRRGRYFTEADDERAPQVAIVNEELVTRYLHQGDPIGKRLLLTKPVLGRNGFGTAEWIQVVGVVGNVRMSARSPELKPILYLPYAQGNWTTGVWFTARTNLNPSALTSAVRGEFMRMDPDQPIEQITDLDRMLADQLAQPRFQTGLMGAFALLALVLAAIGVYGVNAYAVSQRRSEIGLRMALGATPRDILREVAARGMAPAAIGIGAGTLGSVAVTSALKSVLVGAGAASPLSFFAAVVLLALVSAAACYFPASRATRIDPAIALRAD
ncbi:MAG TPA: ABC transporter permease [Bryobacteraceae bacterium]|jgi:putative ABC transport system permease protein